MLSVPTESNALTLVCSRSMASKTPVGFIGLGNMGNPMAKNLMKHGYPLVIYDVFPDACKEFQDAGEQVRSFLKIWMFKNECTFK